MSSPCASRKCHIVCVLLSDTILRSPTLTTPPLHRSHPHDTPTCAHTRLCLSFYLGGHHSNPLSLLPHLHFLACLCPDLLWAPRAGGGGWFEGELPPRARHLPGDSGRGLVTLTLPFRQIPPAGVLSAAATPKPK